MTSEKQSVIFMGDKHEVHLPSGKVVIIRETNGEDDAIFSNIGDIRKGTNLDAFLANIVVEDRSTGKQPLASDILNWKIADSWYLLFKQRIINRGNELVFKYACENESCKSKPIEEFREDLNLIDGDLSIPYEEYKPGPDQVKKYPAGSTGEIIFEVGPYTLKFDIKTGVHDAAEAQIPTNNHNVNTPLLIRNIKLKNPSTQQWEHLFKFSQFSSKVMSEIRSKILKYDPLFNPIVQCKCSYCNNTAAIPLFNISNFFWPQETVL